MAEDKVGVDKISADKITADETTEDKISADNITADKATKDKIKPAADRTTKDKIEADNTTKDKIAADKTTKDKIEADKTTEDKIEADKTTKDNIEVDNVTAEETTQDKIATDNPVPDKISDDKTAADKFLLPWQRCVPRYGWRVAFDASFAKCRPFRSPRASQLSELIGYSLRYFFNFYLKKRFLQRRRPFIDALRPWSHRPMFGVPIGGIGAGSIGRGFRGEFCRFQMLPGVYRRRTVEADCFILTVRRASADSTEKPLMHAALTPKKFKSRALRNWRSWGGTDAAYHGLYPRSWTAYRTEWVDLMCRQTTPVVGHDYRDSCLPLALFEWKVQNRTDQKLHVSITFCFKNGDGSSGDRQGGVTTEVFKRRGEESCQSVVGCLIHQRFRGAECAYGVSAVEEGEHCTVSLCPAFDPVKSSSDANALWQSLSDSGSLKAFEEAAESVGRLGPTRKGEERGVAVCVRLAVEAGDVSDSARFCLAWHMPKLRFRAGQQEYTRRHVRWFTGSQSDATVAMATYAFASSCRWQQQIAEWQSPVLDNPKLPDWLKSALFNESYFLSDSGSVWLDGGDVNDSHRGRWRCPFKEEMGIFAYLEGHEYRMYSTYDVHSYASWALLENFPKLQAAIQYDFAKAAVDVDEEQVHWLVTNTRSQRNQAMTLPHDLGDPEDEPFVKVNGYVMLCSSQWRDLNPKFVLVTYRDWKLLPSHNREFLLDMLPIVEGLMQRCLQWDTDGDGLIENTGYADQTYDAWTMTGVSAYCGCMWLAAMQATSEMLSSVGRESDAEFWVRLLTRGRREFESKLWTGRHYRFDTGGRFAESVMSDQLFGHWMLRLSASATRLLPADRVDRTLRTIVACNSRRRMGIFNGARLDGSEEVGSIQAEESWIGVSYAVASLMVSEGLVAEGLTCAKDTYRTVWHDLGLAYQTPESIFPDCRYRSLGYMRPLCVWALLRAFETKRLNDTTKTSTFSDW